MPLSRLSNGLERLSGDRLEHPRATSARPRGAIPKRPERPSWDPCTEAPSIGRVYGLLACAKQKHGSRAAECGDGFPVYAGIAGTYRKGEVVEYMVGQHGTPLLTTVLDVDHNLAVTVSMDEGLIPVEQQARLLRRARRPVSAVVGRGASREAMALERRLLQRLIFEVEHTSPCHCGRQLRLDERKIEVRQITYSLPGSRASESCAPPKCQHCAFTCACPWLQNLHGLVAARADVNGMTPKGDTPLLVAARVGQLRWVAALVAVRASPATSATASQWTPLHEAAKRGRRDLCQALMRADGPGDVLPPTGAEAFLHRLVVRPFGVLGVRCTAAGAEEQKGPEPDSLTAVVDIVRAQSPEHTEQSSEAIYEWLGASSKLAFPDVPPKVVAFGDKKVIRVACPDLADVLRKKVTLQVQSPECLDRVSMVLNKEGVVTASVQVGGLLLQRGDALQRVEEFEALAGTYCDIFASFADSGLSRLRFPPIDCGGAPTSELPTATARALVAGFLQLGAERQRRLLVAESVELCVIGEADYEDFAHTVHPIAMWTGTEHSRFSSHCSDSRFEEESDGSASADEGKDEAPSGAEDPTPTLRRAGTRVASLCPSCGAKKTLLEDKAFAVPTDGDVVARQLRGLVSIRCCTTGLTPLLVAARGGFEDIVADMIQEGALVNIQAEDGTTALMSAAKRGDRQTCELLIHSGCYLCAKRCQFQCSASWHAPLLNSQHESALSLSYGQIRNNPCYTRVVQLLDTHGVR